MREVALQFLTGVLGTDGARALARTAEREPALTAVLVPRTALAWLRDLDKHEGNLPGVETSYLKFQKNEVGYAGVVSLPDAVNYEFEAATPEHVAAAIAYAVGTVGSADPAVRDLTLSRLGKSIDALARAQILVKALPKALALKAEPPGQTHQPTGQQGPQEAQPPMKQPKQAKPKLPKAPKLPALKVEKAEAASGCPLCGGAMFDAKQKFTGCVCFRDLAKHVRTTVYGDGMVLEFGPGYPAGAWPELRKALKGDQ